MVDQYLNKQLPMILSPEQIKEQGLDKASTQLKTSLFLRLIGETVRKN